MAILFLIFSRKTYAPVLAAQGGYSLRKYAIQFAGWWVAVHLIVRRRIRHDFFFTSMNRSRPCLLLAGLLLANGCSIVLPEKRISKPLAAGYSVGDPQFSRSLGHLLSASMIGGNQITVLLNGDQTFPAMLEAIRHAEKSITLEANICESGKIVSSFVDALTERARAGVKVHMIVDAIASMKLSRADANALRDAGVELAFFNPPYPFRLSKVKHRTHRKLLVVDGRIGFAGGVCLSDDWSGNAEAGHWRDTHFRVEGPVVAQMQAVFTENWLQTRSEVLHGNDYFPTLQSSGAAAAQFFRSGPEDNAENARISYLLAVAAARNNIRLAHAYFLPNDVSVEALIAARKRGVKVEIILPAKGDHFSIQRASRTRWGKLLDAGVEFYEYQPTLFHCKIMIVDNQWMTAGSVNFDERSFRFNDEANLNVLNRDLANQLVQTFEDDKAKSRRLEASDFKRRNWFGRIFDQFFGLFRSEM
jgi:cardiolipin synthase A/B